MSKQKFHKGDVVRVADDLGPSMKHFSGAGKEATVVGSYADQYPHFDPNATKDYTLDFGDYQSSWYHEHQLTLVQKNKGV